MKRTVVTAAACAGLVAALAATDVNDWPSHDRDAGGQRFSPLKQITPANVGRLQAAWTFDTGATGIHVTPLVVGGIKYVAAGRDIVALEPETAKIIWKYTAPAAVSRRGVAYSAPPFGELVAVDVNRGEIAWRVPIGFVESLKAKGFDKTGTLNIGGSIATAGGVIFIGATIDCRFRAFESKTGRQLWETELPACAHAVPMTFLGKDGRQYVAVAAGGGSYLGAAPGSKIVAFALPRP